MIFSKLPLRLPPVAETFCAVRIRVHGLSATGGTEVVNLMEIRS